jgi:endogenous inhibitor of DNA gyrase (YacG/DUF329 family)
MTEDRSQDEGKEPPSAPRCPLCGKPRVQRFRPFCSARCRDVDLGRWFAASYAVPAVEPGYDEDADEEG